MQINVYASALSLFSRRIKSRVTSARRIDFAGDFKHPLKPKWQADCPRDVYLESLSILSLSLALFYSLALSITLSHRFPPFSFSPPQYTFRGRFSRASTRKTEKVEGLSELFLAGSTSSRFHLRPLAPSRTKSRYILRGRGRRTRNDWTGCRREKFPATLRIKPGHTSAWIIQLSNAFNYSG